MPPHPRTAPREANRIREVFLSATARARYLDAFNVWAHERGGIPLLNQSPRLTHDQVTAAYGERWKAFGDWVRSVDSQGGCGIRL